MRTINPLAPDPSRPFDLLVIGELNVDLVLKGNIEPEFGQVEKVITSADLTLGSSAAIMACGAARLGLRVAFIGVLGTDTFGSFIKEELKKREVDTSRVIEDPKNPTGISVILSKDNDRAILTCLGCINQLKADEIDPEVFQLARHVHVSSYYFLDNLRADLPALFRKAHQHGMTTSLDTNFDPLNQWGGGIQEILPETDIFLPNLTEALRITNTKDLDQAVDRLMKTVPVTAVKLGSEGALLAEGGQIHRTGVIPVKVEDTVGAGDSFDAGLLAGFLGDSNWPTSLKLASICGSLSTTASGGTAGQPTLEKAQTEMKKLP